MARRADAAARLRAARPATRPAVGTAGRRRRAAAAGFPLTFVADPWLHVTLEQITDTAGANITAAERIALAEALQDRLATTAPLQVTVGSPLSYPTGIMLDLYPDEPLITLHEAIRQTVTTVRGPNAARYDVGIPHLTIAYARAEGDSDDIQRSLRRVRPSHAPLHIDIVHLVEVTTDPDAKTITWDTVAAISLQPSAD